MRCRATTNLALGLALALCACGYAASGTWEDDPDNWERAFGSVAPDTVEVVHSKYWRSPHFTYECAYYFEIAPNADVEREILETNPSKRLEGREAAMAMYDVIGAQPKWFTPRRSADDYEVWTAADDSRNFRLYIDRETRTLFLTDGQL